MVVLKNVFPPLLLFRYPVDQNRHPLHEVSYFIKAINKIFFVTFADFGPKAPNMNFFFGIQINIGWMAYIEADGEKASCKMRSPAYPENMGENLSLDFSGISKCVSNHDQRALFLEECYCPSS